MTVKQEKQEKGKQGETRRWVSVRRRGDPGKIHRSKEFGVQGCRREYGEGRCWRREQGTRIKVRGGQGEGMGEDETRTVMCGGVLGNPVGNEDRERAWVRMRQGW